MSTSTVVPGPRSALDEGTVHDLCVDGAQVVLAPHPVVAPASPHRASPTRVSVPDDASRLLEDLPPYGT